MPDSFSQVAYASPKSLDEMWRMLAEAGKAIQREDARGEDQYPSPPRWTVLTSGRSWDRPTPRAARAAAEAAELVHYAADLSYYGRDLQWSVTGRKDEQGFHGFELRCYAGRDRLRTEEVFRDVVNRLARRGIALRVRASRVTSSDDGSGPAPSAPLAPRPNRSRTWDAVARSVKKHVGSYVVGVLLLITGGILAALGFKVI